MDTDVKKSNCFLTFAPTKKGSNRYNLVCGDTLLEEEISHYCESQKLIFVKQFGVIYVFSKKPRFNCGNVSLEQIAKFIPTSHQTVFSLSHEDKVYKINEDCIVSISA